MTVERFRRHMIGSLGGKPEQENENENEKEGGGRKEKNDKQIKVSRSGLNISWGLRGWAGERRPP